jgi:hypothetical protein
VKVERKIFYDLSLRRFNVIIELVTKTVSEEPTAD